MLGSATARCRAWAASNWLPTLAPIRHPRCATSQTRAAVCTALSLRNTQRFDFGLLADRVTSFHREQEALTQAPAQRPVVQPAKG